MVPTVVADFFYVHLRPLEASFEFVWDKWVDGLWVVSTVIFVSNPRMYRPKLSVYCNIAFCYKCVALLF